MLQETMKTVCDAENDADDIVKKAKEDADGIIADAKQKAKDIVLQAETDAKAEKKAAEQAGKTEEEKLTTQAMDRATAKIGSLRDAAKAKEQAAIDMIIDEII